MSDRIQYVVIGAVCGLFVNLLMDAVRQWRQENIRRERIRKYLMVIKGELEDRIELVISHCDDDDVKFETYRGLAGNPRMIEAELAERNAVYRTHSAMLLEIPERVSIAVSQHYLYDRRILIGRQQAIQNIMAYKNSIDELISHVSSAAASAGPIAFLRWMPKWLMGTA